MRLIHKESLCLNIECPRTEARSEIWWSNVSCHRGKYCVCALGISLSWSFYVYYKCWYSEENFHSIKIIGCENTESWEINFYWLSQIISQYDDWEWTGIFNLRLWAFHCIRSARLHKSDYHNFCIEVVKKYFS